MAGLAKQAVAWLRSQSDLTHHSLTVAATASALPLLPHLSPPALASLNLAAVAVQFGAQNWVAWVAGPTMFLNMPRNDFGNIQARLFPKLGMVSVATGGLTLASYSLHHPVDTATYLLAASLACNCLNSFLIFPKTTELQFLKRGIKDEKEKAAAERRFGMVHGVSVLVNLVSMVANLAYICLLGSQLSGQW